MATADEDEDYNYQASVKRDFERILVKGAPQLYSQDEYDFAVRDLWSWFVAEARAAGTSIMSWEDFQAIDPPPRSRKAGASVGADKGKGKAKELEKVSLLHCAF